TSRFLGSSRNTENTHLLTVNQSSNNSTHGRPPVQLFRLLPHRQHQAESNSPSKIMSMQLIWHLRRTAARPGARNSDQIRWNDCLMPNPVSCWHFVHKGCRRLDGRHSINALEYP